MHYSNLAQINRDNVSKLQVAWTYATGESGGLETTSLVIAGVLYGLTPKQEVFALNAATAKRAMMEPSWHVFCRKCPITGRIHSQ
jgi:quinoprotein glucose dehydrogenase